ncbi:hypothetical protein GCM10023149_19450 [Mucilaginibacter gynuensis]|uniref:OmpL-like beta-barrel porin-2 n=1 Tax=Mucilaginibacter gynuensis TaxID=1302236 RepID=A0ABP8GAH2_9SPHI
MKKLLIPALLLLAACQNKPLVDPGTASGKLNNGKLRTFAGTTRTDSLYGGSVHFGTANNQDYLGNKIGYAMKLARMMHWNYFRADASTDSLGNPSNANFAVFVDSAYNAGFGVFAVLSNPNLAAPAAPASGYTTSELNAFYQKGYNKGYGFINRFPGKIGFLQVYNELELDNNADLLRSTYHGTATPTDTEVNLKYNMAKYKAYLQYLSGMYSGAKAANSNIRVGMNYGWIHYGLFRRFALDMKAINKKLDFMGLDWYNDSEYGTDRSHNVSPIDTPMANKAIVRLKLKFIDSSLVTQVGITETGISFGGTPSPGINPNGLGKGGFLTLMHNQYKSNCNFLFYYELFKEPLTRGSGTKEAEFGIQTPTNLSPNILVTDTLSLLH